MTKALTDVAIRNLKPRATRYEVPDSGARGLYLQVQPSGRRGFAVRYRYNGTPRKLTLTPGLSLAAARKAAADAMYELEQGRDPATTRQERRAEAVAAKAKAAAAANNTLFAVCDEYFRRPEHQRLRSLKQRRDTMARLVYAELGDRQIDGMKRSEIVRLLDKIEDERGAVQADIALSFLRSIMNWHARRSDEFRTPIVRGMARTKPSERARARVLDDGELRAVWTTADKLDGPFPAMVKFLLLTAARRSEAAALPWDEIAGADWILPAARNKTKQELTRPLSRAVQDLLAARPKSGGGPYVFSINGGRYPFSSFSKGKREFDAACGVRGWTIHDLRRTARSLMSRAGVPSDAAEKCLGHVLPGLIRQTYDRHQYREEMRIAYEKLATLIETIVNPPASVVTPLRRR
jgi:integrase